MISQISLLLTSALLSLVLCYLVVWLAKLLDFQQNIRAEAPANHQQKSGTPTMGGLGFILAIITLGLIIIDVDIDGRYLALILLAAGYALIGLTDDLLKIIRKQNLGLTFWQKIISQVVLAGSFSLFVGAVPDASIGASWWQFFFWVFIIVGAANATNLTDGLNGLLAGTAGIAYLAFAVLASRLGFSDAASFCLITAGSVLAFLYYNFPRARIFMGDVGSLPLGAGLAGAAILIGREWSLAVIGGIFVIEAISVITQVASFKLFKKRIFKMSPLHHHFELLGFKELQIVLSFWIAAIAFGALGIYIHH